MVDKVAILLALRDASSSSSSSADSVDDACGVQPIDKMGLRVGAIFIVLVTSLCGTFFPIVTRRIGPLRKIIPGVVFEFAKFFGSGVILATAIIHLLEPAADEEIGVWNTVANGGCIATAWAEYPFAFGICLASLFFTFVMELCAYRIGTAYLVKKGIAPPPTHGLGTVASAHAPDDDPLTDPASQAEKAVKLQKSASDSASSLDVRWTDASETMPAVAQILGVTILEFGVIIGLTLALASPDEFTTLFIVIVFHQMFEGLGLGARLSFLKLPDAYKIAPYIGALLYTLMTPIGMAIGLGARSSLSMTSAAASIASGVLDSTSAGILIYAATVELIAHEFIFNHFYHTCSWKRVVFSLGCFASGAGLMALLGKWA